MSANETERLAALASYDILDTPPERAFDGLTKLAAHVLDVPMVLVTVVDADRVWFKSAFGIDASEVPREVSFCGHVVALDQPLVVPDATRDERFSASPLVTGPPQVRFYAGFPIRNPEGYVLGTFCGIDTKERELDPTKLEALEILAEEAMARLELRRKSLLLAEERVRLQGVLEAAVDAILTVGEDGAVESINAATEEMFGYGRDEIVGASVTILMPEPYSLEHDGYLSRYLETGESHVIGSGREIVARRKDGTTFPGELSLGEMSLRGRRAFIGILRDISARKNAERHRDDALEELTRSRDNLLEVLNQLRVGTLAVNSAGQVTFASRSSYLASGKPLDPKERPQWEDALDVGEPARRSLRSMMRRPEEQRARVAAYIGSKAEGPHVEIEIRDDPRDRSGRLFHIYDVSELRALRDELTRRRSGLMVGESEAMQELYLSIEQVSSGDWTVLVQGETGSGKELVAHAIHRASPRQAGPFVAVNCAGLTESILGSQLFGHAKGAFTGATADKLGYFEAASGGTLFLDEIGDVGLTTQGALLRALQEREITRLGETKTRKVDVRVIAATNRDLSALVASGKFREDLLYRIRNARILVPPLRQRKEDVTLLVSAFLAEERVTGGKLINNVSSSAMEALIGYEWPGNVRELRGAIEHAVVRCRGRTIELSDLPPEIASTPQRVDDELGQVYPLKLKDESGMTRSDHERHSIIEALRRTGGNRAKAARLLKMGRATLYRRLSELAIAREKIEDTDLT